MVRRSFFVLTFSLLFLLSIVCAAQVPFQGDFLPPTSLGAGNDTWGVAVGDFNGDTKLDIATTNPGESKVTIFTGNGDGSFTAGASYQLTAGRNNTLWVTTADVNGDGKLDLIVTSFNFTDQSGGKISVLVGNGDGTFQPEVDYAAGSHPITVVAADFNGDGKPDLAVTDNGSAALLVFINNGDGTFQGAQSYAVGTGPYSLATGDFNGDGKADLVAGNYCNVANAFPGQSPSAFYCEAGPTGTTLSILLGNGDGTFQTQKTVTVDTDPYQVVAVDLNQDGKADIALTDGDYTSSPNQHNVLVVLLSNGDGTFQPARYYFSVTFGPNFALLGNTFMAVGDFNGDGKLDIDNYVTEFLGNGDGTFQAGIVYPNGASLAQIAAPQAVGDFNQDGHPDVVTGGDAATIALNAASTTRFSTTTTTVATSYICSVGITATVASSAGPLPTGGVSQQVDGQFAGYLGLPNFAGMVTGGTGLLLPGNHTIAIAYSGDLSTQGSIGSAMVTTNLSDTAPVISSDQNPAIEGYLAYIRVRVTSNCSLGPGTDLGTVTFLDGATPLQTSPLNSRAEAALPLNILSVGTHQITASYSGTSYAKPSVSPGLNK